MLACVTYTNVATDGHIVNKDNNAAAQYYVVLAYYRDVMSELPTESLWFRPHHRGTATAVHQQK